MKAQPINKKCAICGAEHSYIVILSNYVKGTSDLDLMPNGSMAGLGSEIQMCPTCGYCNYDVSKHIQSRFAINKNPLELWKEYSEVQEVINSNYNNVVKKYLILAIQQEGNLNYKNAYKHYIHASWSADSREQNKEFINKAIELYIENVLPETRTELMQMADILRQAEEFEVSDSFVNAVGELINSAEQESEFLNKVVEFEKQLIKNKDSKKHNTSEVK